MQVYGRFQPAPLECSLMTKGNYALYTQVYIVKEYSSWGVYKQWNGILEWWNTGMVKRNFLKFNIIFYIQISTTRK